MAEPRLGPDELDRLEDALEELEFLEDQTLQDEPSPQVRERLADFKLILAASRAALPLEDVPAGVLDGVIREASMSPEDMPVVDVAAAQSSSWWSRFRKSFLLPTLAVAGSAALVLIIVQPQMGAGPVMNEDGAIVADKSGAKESPASAAAPLEEARSPSDPAAVPPPPAAAAPGEPTPLGSVEGQSKSSRNFRSQLEQAPAKAEPEPEPDRIIEEESKNDDADKKGEARISGWDAIEDGDRARKGGDCFTARNHYARALDDGNDSVRARAYVGMSLCKADDGDDAAATEYMRKAEELDPDVADFAQTQAPERKAKPSAPRPKKKRSGKRRKSGIDFDEAADPFE